MHKNKSILCLSSHPVPSALLLPAADPLPPLLPLPPLPGFPTVAALPALRQALLSFSSWLPWRPVTATSLVKGAWWNLFLELRSISALLERILTGSLTCLVRQLLKLLKAFIWNWTFSPSCSRLQCFHSGLSSSSLLRFSWCSSPRE